MKPIRALLWAALILAAGIANATSFVVPDDAALFGKADAVVQGVVVTSRAQLADGGWAETVATVRISEAIKGPFTAGDVVEIHSPGGDVPGRAWRVHAAPRWRGGRDVLLFLFESRPGRWALVDLAVGKFEFATDRNGRSVAVRQEGDILGTDPSGGPFVERRRGGPEFVEYLRQLARGERPSPGYTVKSEPLALEDAAADPGAATMEATAAPAVTYSMEMGGGNGARWTVFPSAVAWRHYNAAAVSGASESMSAAANAWNADSGSNVAYSIVGASAFYPPSGLFGATDGENTIKWETDLPDIQDYTCTSGGVVGLGGISAAGGPIHTHGGGSFYTTIEGDVDMNRGVACAPADTKNTGLAHELGHTLGFRHSDKTRDNNAACAAPLSCSSSSVMRSMLVNGINAALQPWDVEAVRAVYPGTTSTTQYLDVPPSSPIYPYVDAITRHGITSGCRAGYYCPNGYVSRAQMAVFLLKAKEGAAYSPPAATGRMFSDVPAGSFGAAWIEEAARRGITGGCTSSAFCPNDPVNRAQMAVFLLKTLLGSGYVPPAAIGRFSDVAASSPFAPWIEQVYVRGITGGCATGPLRYCPTSAVTRGQMAVFLTKTFSLQ